MTDLDDPFDLQRFVDAQQASYAQALREIEHGAKQGHWMWFVFPQVVGLGTSPIARRYAISSLNEAWTYFAHPVLGPRYREIVGALQDIEAADAVAVFGSVDAQKLRSSLTLFSLASEDKLIAAALERWYGEPDQATIAIVG